MVSCATILPNPGPTALPTGAWILLRSLRLIAARSSQGAANAARSTIEDPSGLKAKPQAPWWSGNHRDHSARDGSGVADQRDAGRGAVAGSSASGDPAAAQGIRLL